MIDPALPMEIADHLNGRDLNADTLSQLRRTYPQAHFTVCSDDDVLDAVNPFIERPGLRIYLVDASDHCLSLTSEPESASGLLLAAVAPEEDE